MSKLANVMKKGTIWSILLAVVLAAGLVIGIVFGFNPSLANQDSNTLTVSIDGLYKDDLDDLQTVCDNTFSAKGVTYISSSVVEMYGNDCEVTYIFEKDVNLEEVKTALRTNVAELTKENAVYDGAQIIVSSGVENVTAFVPTGYALRGAIALAVVAVLAFAYTAIRYRWDMGVMVAGSIVLGALLTAALIALVRIPVTNALLYVVAFGAIAAAVMTLLTMNKVSKKQFSSEADEAEELADCVAVKEISTLTIVGAGALVVIGVAGVIANVTLLWFALGALIAVCSAALIGLVYVPTWFLPLKKAADQKAADKASGYKGAQKTAAAVKKLFTKKEKDESEEA